VATRALQREGRIDRALVVDLDVHQGDGTAAIFAGDESVFTFSMHAAKNFPFQKQRSSLDVALPDGCRDSEYIEVLERHLPGVLERSRPSFADVAGIAIAELATPSPARYLRASSAQARESSPAQAVCSAATWSALRAVLCEAASAIPRAAATAAIQSRGTSSTRPMPP